MKKYCCILMCLILLCGCSKAKGSFAEGNRDMKQLYEDICEKINDGEWDMAPLDEALWSKRRIEKDYHIDLTNVKDCYVMSSAIEAEFGEIAFFQVTKEKEPSVKDAIAYRLNTLNKTWGNYMLDAQELLQNVRQGRIGQYYYMILGEDSKKVVNYIQEMK